MEIVEAIQKDMLNIRELFLEYQEWLGIDLCFQGFDQELATLPGCYAPPKGAILIAIIDKQIIGCVCVRPRTNSEAELKRLYVKPNHQGLGVGKKLLHLAMLKAQKIGYTSIALDTLPSMLAAKSLYEDYGFYIIPAYYKNPIEGAEYYRYEFA